MKEVRMFGVEASRLGSARVGSAFSVLMAASVWVRPRS